MFAEQLKKKQGEGTLVILEGWNELRRDLQEKPIFQALVERGGHSPLQKAVVLVSSRSNTTVNLHRYTAMRIEALGFTRDQIEAYVKDSFESKAEPQKAQELLEIIQLNPKLRENCYLPLMLIIIVHLYDCSETLPESFCGIIIQLALSCLYRYYRKKGRFNDDDDDPMPSIDKVPPDIQPELDKLCKLAYDATLKDIYSFSDPQTDGLGLLQNVRSIAGRGSRVTQYFLHSSLQELCAALHVSRQPVQRQREMVEEMVLVPRDYMLRFYSAITGFQNESVREVLIRHTEYIQEDMNELFLIPTMPEPLSHSLLLMSNELLRYPTRFLNVLKYMLDTVIDEKPFDRDKLVPNLSMGGPETEPLIQEQAKFVEEIIMQLADESFDPETFRIDDERFKEKCLRTIERISIRKGLAPEATSAFSEAFYQQTKSLLFYVLSKLESFANEVIESFGTHEIPQEILQEQIIQKLQQEIRNIKPFQDPKQTLGFPLSPQQQVSHQTHSCLQEQMKMITKDKTFAELMKSMMPDFLQLNANPDPCNFMKIFFRLMQNVTHAESSMTGHQLTTSLLHGRTTVSHIMLLHCANEAQNPLLASLLGPSLVLMGNLNGSDFLALQNVCKMKVDGRSACNIENLYLITAISLKDVIVLSNAIKATTALKRLGLSIGPHDEELVQQVLEKPTIKHLQYSWIIADEDGRKTTCKSFCGCLQYNEYLQVLDLSGLSILDIGAVELARVLNTTQVIELDVSRCGIEEEGIKALSRMLEHNCSLSTLYLNETKFSSTALESLSRCLVQNNTLKVLGIAEDPAAAELSEKNLQDFLVRLCFNSSIVCVILNGKYMHTPSLQQALTLVNCTRRLKHQPLLSIDDHYPKNYCPDLYNEFEIHACKIRERRSKSINCSVGPVTQGCYIMQELPAQIWSQTLPSTLCFIDEMKAVRNMSLRRILKPISRPTTVRAQPRKALHARDEQLTVLEAQRIAPPDEMLPLQEQQHTLTGTLNFISSFKAVHNMCLRRLLLPRPRAVIKTKPKINRHPLNSPSRYPAVVEKLEGLHQDWHQSLFGTECFIRCSKAVRNMTLRKLLYLEKPRPSTSSQVLLIAQHITIHKHTTDVPKLY